MGNTLPISDVITMSVSFSPTPAQPRSIASALVLGTSAVLPLYDRVRTYTALVGGVDADFASNTDEYKAAAAWFGQPNAGPLKIGRKFTTAQSGVLRSGTASSTLSDYTGITNGGFDININGTNRQIFGLDFSGAADLPAVAALIQTKLAAAVASTTCTWNATRKQFILTVAGSTGTGSTIGYAVAPTGGSSPTNQSSFLKLTVTDGAQATNGIAIETVTAAWTASAAWDPAWYGMIICGTTAQDSKDSMAFAQAGFYHFMDATADVNCTDSTATSDLAYYAKNLGYSKNTVIYDNVNSDKFACAAALSLMLSTDYTQQNSIRSLKFRTLAGYAPVVITETQRLALIAKNCNFYANYGNVPMMAEGTVANGRFVDAVLALDAFTADCQTALFNVLYTSPANIPQTDEGGVRCIQGLVPIFEKYRNAGLFAGGVWNGPPVGQIKTGQYVQNGWYAVAAPVSTQSASDRALRKAPPISAIGIGAGAIHSANIAFTFQS
jgi:hypothetical protein